MTWFLGCLDRAIQNAVSALEEVFIKARFWDSLQGITINSRQEHMLNMLLDGFAGKLTTMKWAKLNKCSHDTALRDIQDLIKKNVLVPEEAGGRSTSYAIKQTSD